MRFRSFVLAMAAIGGLFLSGGISQAQTAPPPQCTSGPVQIDAVRTVVITPDCSNPTRRAGTTAYVAWLHSLFSQIGTCPAATDPSRPAPPCGFYVSIYTFNDPDVKAVWVEAEAAGIPVHVELDYSEMQAVGAANDKKEAEGEQVKHQSEHMIANDLCTAKMDVVWGTSPAGSKWIDHDKVTIAINNKGQPIASSYGSLNYSTEADFEANFIVFDSNPTMANLLFQQWMWIHDSMVEQAKPFYAPLSEKKMAKLTADEQAAMAKRPQVCPALDQMPKYGAATVAPAQKKEHKRRKKDD